MMGFIKINIPYIKFKQFMQEQIQTFGKVGGGGGGGGGWGGQNEMTIATGTLA